MYREKIRDFYEHLSRSYRRVADYIMSNYYEVSFMTAAQLAHAVGVDTTTVVRFSQRVGYNGYPELLADIREQVRAEIYGAYTPRHLSPDDPSTIFKDTIEQAKQNLAQMQVHAPPEHIAEIASLIAKANHIVLLAEGYAEAAARIAAEQMRHRGLSAEAISSDPVQQAGALINLTPETVIIGVGAGDVGRAVARAMAYARGKGCATLGVVGSLDNPINRMADRILYAPTKTNDPLPNVVSLLTAFSALVSIISRTGAPLGEKYSEDFGTIYQFLIQPEREAPPDETIEASEAAKA